MVHVVLFSTCFNSFLYFCRMVRAVLSFKLGKVDTNLRTVAKPHGYYSNPLSWSVYFLYGPQPLFLWHWKIISSQHPNRRNREVFLLPEAREWQKLHVFHGYHWYDLKLRQFLKLHFFFKELSFTPNRHDRLLSLHCKKHNTHTFSIFCCISLGTLQHHFVDLKVS